MLRLFVSLSLRPFLPKTRLFHLSSHIVQYGNVSMLKEIAERLSTYLVELGALIGRV